MSGMNAGEKDTLFDRLSKAFKSYSNAVKTPGFADVLAKIGAATAGEGTIQQGLAGVAMSTANQRAYSNYVNKLMAGETPTQADLAPLTSDQITQGRQMLENKQKIAIQQQEANTAAASQAASQTYMEGQVAGLPKSFGEKIQAEKDLATHEAGLREPKLVEYMEGNNVVAAYWDDASKSFVEVSRGIPSNVQAARFMQESRASAKGVPTASQLFGMYKSNYNMVNAALQNKYVQSKDLSMQLDEKTGRVVPVWKNTDAQAVYERELGEAVKEMQRREAESESPGVGLPATWGTFPEYSASTITPGATGKAVDKAKYKTFEDVQKALAAGELTLEEAIEIGTPLYGK